MRENFIWLFEWYNNAISNNEWPIKVLIKIEGGEWLVYIDTAGTLLSYAEIPNMISFISKDNWYEVKFNVGQFQARRNALIMNKDLVWLFKWFLTATEKNKFEIGLYIATRPEGWLVGIGTAGTSLGYIERPEQNDKRSSDNWISIRFDVCKFVGSGSFNNLHEIIQIFREESEKSGFKINENYESLKFSTISNVLSVFYDNFNAIYSTSYEIELLYKVHSTGIKFVHNVAEMMNENFEEKHIIHSPQDWISYYPRNQTFQIDGSINNIILIYNIFLEWFSGLTVVKFENRKAILSVESQIINHVGYYFVDPIKELANYIYALESKSSFNLIIETIDNPGWTLDVRNAPKPEIFKKFIFEGLDYDQDWVRTLNKGSEQSLWGGAGNLVDIIQLFLGQILVKDCNSEVDRLHKKSELEWLTNWYEIHCDGDWEHSYGVKIAIGSDLIWNLSIDLIQTFQEAFSMDKVTYLQSDKDWYVCQIHDGIYQASGTLFNLSNMIKVFQKWSDELDNENFDILKRE